MTTNTLNRPHNIIQLHPIHSNNEEEIITHTFSSHDELLHTIMQQTDVFMANSIIKEINELNDNSVISEYDIKNIKSYYAERERNSLKHVSRINSIVNSKELSSRGVRVEKVDRSIARRAQRGYMEMLSRQIHSGLAVSTT